MKKRNALPQRILSLLLAVVLLAGAIPITVQAAEDTTFEGFTDVQATDYYAEAVEWAVDKAITTGTTATTFSPASTVTRQEAVTFLWRAMGRPEPTSSVSTFTDVTDSGAYYYDAILWATEEGLVNGVGGGLFDRAGTLTYDHIFAILCRAAGGAASGSTWSADAVRWAQNNGLTTGLTYTAKGGCPRSDVVYCLWKQLGGQEEQSTSDLEHPALSDEAGATLAIITGFLDKKAAIDISDFNLEASQAEQLALKIADIDGKNPYNVTHVNAYEQDGKIAKTLAAYYTTSSATAAVNDWRVISEEVQAEAQRVVDEIITSSMSDYEIAKALHDYLILNCDYDKRLYSGDMPYISHKAEGALLEGTAVCSGYAKAYEALMNAAGVPCEYVGNSSHGWNIVEIDGAWYHVDTTWDDPINRGGDFIRYDYFLKSDAYMRRDHASWTADHVCTSTKYDGVELPDTTEQAKQEVLNQILTICYDAIKGFPYQTEAALQAATEDQLQDARYAYIDFSGSGIDASDLSQYRGQVSQVIVDQYPDYMVMSFDSTNMCYQIRRADVMEEIRRRQGLQQEEQEQQQHQQDTENAAAAAQIQPLLQQAIVNGACETYEVNLTGYTDDAIELACDNMCTEGYSFGGYTYHTSWATTDYRLSAKSGGVVSITNKKWAAQETARYVEEIEAGLDARKNRIELQPGIYADGKQGSYYASRAANTVKASGYTTPGGLAFGVDYEITASGTNGKTGVFSLTIRYLNQEALSVDEYAARIEDAIRNRESSVMFQYQDGDDSGDNIYAAYEKVSTHGHTVDGLVAGTDYYLTLGKSFNAKTCTVTITYRSAQ